MRAHARMLEFTIGDRVSFQPEGRPLVVGMLIRYNRKTVTVITDTGQRWNVAPTLLRRRRRLRGARTDRRRTWSSCTDVMAHERPGRPVRLGAEVQGTGGSGCLPEAVERARYQDGLP